MAACPACARIFCGPRCTDRSIECHIKARRKSCTRHANLYELATSMSKLAMARRTRCPRTAAYQELVGRAWDALAAEVIKASLSKPPKRRAELGCARRGAVTALPPANVYLLELGTAGTPHLEAARHVFEELREGAAKNLLSFRPKRYEFRVERPSSWRSDIRWISANDESTLSFFERLFDRLGIARLLLSSLGLNVRMFAGYVRAIRPSSKSTASDALPMHSHAHDLVRRPHATHSHWRQFVARRVARAPHFHYDFTGTGAHAFTLMTPLYDMSSLPHCHLLCEAPAGVQQYRYKLGEAIVFGDDFVHATEAGEAPRALGFLCFTFGTDARAPRPMSDAQWTSVAYYVSQQCPVYRDPAGTLVRSAST